MKLHYSLLFIIACNLLLSPSLLAEPVEKARFAISWIATPEPRITIEDIEKDSKKSFKFASHRPSYLLVLNQEVKGEKFNCAIIGGGCQKNIFLERGAILFATRDPYIIACSARPVTKYVVDFRSEYEYMCLEDKDNDKKFESIFLTKKMVAHAGPFMSFSSKIPSKRGPIDGKSYSEIDPSTLPPLISYFNFKDYNRNNTIHKIEWVLKFQDKDIYGLVSYKGNLHVANEYLINQGSESVFELFKGFALENKFLFF